MTLRTSSLEGLPLHSTNRGRLLVAAILCAVLFSINAYICRDLFFGEVPAMSSMHGYWASIAQRAGSSWFRANWWPWSDLGIPFEFTYAPLVPALTAAIASLRHVSTVTAFQSITAVVYCVGPVTLFLLAWSLSGARFYSFLAALFYSLTAVSRIFAPENAPFSWDSLWDARRLYVTAIWDDTPHMLALTLLPVTLLCLLLTLRTRRVYWAAATAISIALATLASAFGSTTTIIGAACLLFVFQRKDWFRNLTITSAVGLYAWAICAPFFSPSLISAMRAAAGTQESDRWNSGSWTALSLVAVGWAVLWWLLQRCNSSWQLRFTVLLAWVAGCVPLISYYLHRSFLPQPGRYRLELEFAFALLLPFALRSSVGRAPRYVQVCLLFLVCAFAGEQIVLHRVYAKATLRTADLRPTIEARVATWTAQHLSGTRVFMPGTIAMWAGNFAPIEQMGGGAWSMAYNLTLFASEDLRYGALSPGDDARVSLDWLKAFGVGAIVVPGPGSPEYWKGFARPQRFDGILPLVWREDDTSIYRVPSPNPSLAHFVPESALVRSKPRNYLDLGEVEHFVGALDAEPALSARFRWNGLNGATIDAPASGGRAISVQMNWNAGWHARLNGLPVPLRKDGLGLMWMKPECSMPCRIDLVYTGDRELAICRAISYLALAGLPFAFFAGPVVRRRR